MTTTFTTIRVNKIWDIPGFNARNVNRLELESIAEDICSNGGVHTPLKVLKNPDWCPRPEGVKEGEDWYATLCGHRRRGGVCLALSRPDLTQEQRDKIALVPVLIYEGLSRHDATLVMFDHGSVLGLNREETALAIRRLLIEEHLNYVQIGERLQQPIAHNFGNPAMLAKVPTNELAKKKFFADWFRGTVDQYLLKAMQISPYVWSQFLLSCQKADKTLPEGVAYECNLLSRTRVKELDQAKTKDVEDGNWDLMLATGPLYAAKIQQYKDEDAGRATAQTGPKALTQKVLSGKAGLYKSTVLRAAYLDAAGTPVQSVNLDSLDDTIFKTESIFNRLAECKSQLKTPIFEVIDAILTGSLVNLNIALGNVGVKTQEQLAKEEADRKAAEKAEADRKVAEKAEAERKAAEQAEAERKAAEQAEADRKAAERKHGGKPARK